MAKKNIRGVTIEIDGDVSGLTKALTEVNSKVSKTQKELRDVEKLLKLDPGNTELLKQKQQLLAQAVKETSAKLEELNKIQAQLDAQGVDKASEQYMAVRREIIATEDSLKQLEEQAARSNSTLEKIGATADKISAGASKVSEATRGISTAAAGALAGIAGLAYNSITAADDLNTLAKQTGFTTDELQKMKFAADLIDVPMETITSASKKMVKQLGSNEEAFSAIGVVTRDMNGDLRPMVDVFYDTLDALSGIENETERDVAAMEIFGKGADDLAGIIDDGGAALKEYGKQAEEAGLILSQETLDALNDTNDKIDLLKAKMSTSLAGLGAEAAEALLPLFDKIAAGIEKVIGWIGSLDEGQVGLIVNILAVIAAISPVAALIANIAAAVSALIPIITAVWAALSANPIGAIMIAVTALAMLIMAHWDEIKAALGQAWEWFRGTVIDPIVEGVKNLWAKIKDSVSEGWTFIQTLTERVADGIRNAFENVRSAIQNSIADAVSFVVNRVNAAIDTVNSLLNKIPLLNNISIPNINLPGMATGGVISSGSALVGEHGPELLTMLGNRAQITPLTAELSDRAIESLGAGGAQRVKVDISFTGSLSQLARVLQPEIAAETARIGTAAF